MKTLLCCASLLALLLAAGCADTKIKAKGEWQGGISTEIKR